jgi:hypothetical protein
VRKILEETMAADGSEYGLPILFVGESKVGDSWKSV